MRYARRTHTVRNGGGMSEVAVEGIAVAQLTKQQYHANQSNGRHDNTLDDLMPSESFSLCVCATSVM